MTDRIEDFEVSYFYDEDELEKGILSRLSDPGKVKWLQGRINKVFVAPLRKIIHDDPKAENPFRSSECDFMVAAFSVLLNGIESLGSFLTSNKGFKMFIENYLKEWNQIIETLWENYRCGIAHGFVIDKGKGAILYDRKRAEKYWYVENDKAKWLVVDPEKMLNDLEKGIDQFFKDMRNDPSKKAKLLGRFNELYPSVWGNSATAPFPLP